MEIQFRTVQGKVYKLNVDPSSTIGEVKQQLENEHQLPKDKLKMILSAKILNDDQVVSSLNIPAGAYIVVHTSAARKPQPKPQPQLQPETPAPTPAPAPEPAPAPQPAPAPAPAPAPQPAPVTPSQPPSQPRVGFGSGGSGDPGNFEQLVGDLVELGFERSQCEQALRMANYDTERAANLLLTGDIGPSRPSPGGANFGPGPSAGGSGANFGQFQSVYDSFTADEKASVGRLLKYADPETVIQYFMACDKNEEQTLGLLT